MRNPQVSISDETFEQWRARMIAETNAFIEWGLQHPEQVRWIPKHPAGHGSFSEQLKTLFWNLVLRD